MARKLLSRGEAAVFRLAPFTIILKREVSDVQTPDLQLKIDPGSKVTGIAIVNQQTGEVVVAAEKERFKASVTVTAGHCIGRTVIQLQVNRGFG